MIYSQNNIKHENLYSAIIFGVIVLASYSPIIFLDQTYLLNNPIPIEYVESDTKSTVFGFTKDYSMVANYPNIKLSSDMIFDGEIPLWNPYIGLGYPFGADTTHHIFSPLNLGFLLPVEFWDVSFLAIVWIAGFFTFLFLRNLGLNFISSLSGGLFYMLSGAFTLYLPNPNPFVMMATPMILLSIDKIFRNDNPKYIILLSLTYGFSILGGHLQSLFLQSLLVMSYLSYRLFFVIKLKNKNLNPYAPLSGILKRLSLGLVGAFGITAFYTLFAFEYFQNGLLSQDDTWGRLQYSDFSISTFFIPYVLGPLHASWSTNIQGISSPGYFGIIALFFVVFAILLVLKNKSMAERYTPIFFISLAFLAMLRIANFPIISLIGELPVFNLIYFGSYSGVIISFCIAVTASFGINQLGTTKVSKNTIIYSVVFTCSILFISLFPIISEFYGENFSSLISIHDIKNYVTFQVIQSFFFVGIVSLFAFLVMKKNALFSIIPIIIFLELILYIPFGLHPIWTAYKFILVGLVMVSLLICSKFMSFTKIPNRSIFWTVAISLLVVSIIGVTVISEKSPYGLPTKYDSFSDNNVTNFLKNNLDHQRFISFEQTMGPAYPAAFEISSLNTLSSFNIADYASFIELFLDPDAEVGRMGSPPWSSELGPSQSIEKFMENKKYFDFLGVKYILTEGYDFNTFSYGVIGKSGNFLKLGSNANDLTQSFISPTPSIESLGVGLGSTLFEAGDYVILTLDSVPYSEENHRTSKIEKIRNGANHEFKFDSPLENVLDQQFEFSIYFPNKTNEKFVIIYHDNKTYLENSDNIHFFVNGEENGDMFIPFTITPSDKETPVPFNFNEIYINENSNAFPRAFLVHDFVSISSGKGQDYLFNNKEFDLRNSVILETPLSAQISMKTSAPSTNDSVDIVEFNENHITIETFSENDSILVLTDVFYPGWMVSVDGNTSEILRANGLVRAVVVPSGYHTVDFNYTPNSFWLGVLISSVTLVFLTGIFIYSRKFYKNQTP
ncbi:MAG: YfhO family protein [Nitrosarchaeum sp.]|nr:YfhO family protein [Nitrosarchaeum sp.]